jgi:hypothetical protein
MEKERERERERISLNATVIVTKQLGFRKTAHLETEEASSSL